ncbi:MAG: DEAD/DEAH box helicase, partial [Bacteroidetes bacterium]|nr:DEAD/DEAH box helicase [Bacteroidota bacterium]
MKHPKNNFINTPGYQIINNWLAANNREPFAYQLQTWEQISAGKSGLVNAPTGYGKTFSVFLGALIHFINANPNHYKTKQNNGLQLLWITPLRALAKDICRAMQQVIQELEMQWQIGIRNGDTEINIRKKQNAKMPEVLIITPESLHLLLAQKDYPSQFSQLKIIAVDEWHELLGSKRGVQVELAISRLINIKPPKPDTGRTSIWGLSATIGNLEKAKEVLLSPLKKVGIIIKADFQKKIEIQSILPDEIETYPWAGHLGLKLSKKIIPIILKNDSTLIFINTRGMSEAWYQQLLTIEPELAGTMALHHGSIEKYLRTWIEESIQQGRLKAVVCTSSLDLGVDFRPVQAVVQVGSPKGVARFLQRAGRSGHQPGQTSKIYFLPTHSLELLEAAALKKAIDSSFIESRQPLTLCFDVLLQYLTTLAISEGFNATQIFKEIKSTYCYKYLLKSEWTQLLHFLTKGGVALKNYDDYKKVVKVKTVYKINNRTTAMRHRLHIGTIVSDALIKVKFINGEFIGLIEEWFISRLNPGEAFTFAGRNLEFIKLKDLVALVKVSNSTKTIIPSWMGGRLPLSA